jgi:hypothetical protein
MNEPVSKTPEGFSTGSIKPHPTLKIITPVLKKF